MDSDLFFMTHDTNFNSDHFEYIKSDQMEKGSLFALVKLSEVKDKFVQDESS